MMFKRYLEYYVLLLKLNGILDKHRNTGVQIVDMYSMILIFVNKCAVWKVPKNHGVPTSFQINAPRAILQRIEEYKKY